jgi:LPXTG-site transpeptidase (sortase) family protein
MRVTAQACWRKRSNAAVLALVVGVGAACSHPTTTTTAPRDVAGTEQAGRTVVGRPRSLSFLPGESVPTRIRGERGELVAWLTVPKLGLNKWPVRFGVGRDILDRGIGMYPGAAIPGRGNVALAGHRVTPVGGRPFGPFRWMERLDRGDQATVLYDGHWYRYRLVRVRVVRPGATWVLKDEQADLTMTACHPPGSARLRIVSQWRMVD